MKSIWLCLFAVLVISRTNAQKINLQLNLEPGKEYVHYMETASQINQEVNGQKMDIGITISGKTSYKVQDRKDSLYSMEVRYTKLEMKMKLPTGGEIAFGSENKDDATGMSDMLRSLLDKPFLMTMTSHGAITEVKGLDKAFEHMFDKMPQITAAQKEQMLGQMKQSFGEKAFKGSFEMITSIYPFQPVGKGDTWDSNLDLQTNMAAKITTHYTLKDIADKTVHLSGDGKFTTVDDGKYSQVNGIETKYALNGETLTELTIDKQSGWIIEGRVTQKMSGTMEIKDSPTIPGGMTIPMTFQTNMTFKGN